MCYAFEIVWVAQVVWVKDWLRFEVGAVDVRTAAGEWMLDDTDQGEETGAVERAVCCRVPFGAEVAILKEDFGLRNEFGCIFEVLELPHVDSIGLVS